MLIIETILDFFGRYWVVLVSLIVTGIADSDQEKGMIFPGFIPFTGGLVSVVLPVMNLKIRLALTESTLVLISIQNLKSEALPSWIFQALIIKAFLIFNLLGHDCSVCVIQVSDASMQWKFTG
ncbi:hypothetical protein MMU07_03200 [Aquiflexum sp. LQ15W]|uniref:hypothetical protein n=1 Tax=Cognataquiflexum nitidum TaxID=2922272 RepID=UPI001F130CA5|nr:hypothetical protein [Cognataquiflexum nitidum]MCH6198572.1 hypothetical protein [Cognataquiflexum nitidum]